MSLPSLTRKLLSTRQAILGFIYALTRDIEATEEIFQEISITILQQAGKGRDVEPFMPWAREIARRRTAEYFRKRSTRMRIEAPSGAIVDAVSQIFEENEETSEQIGRRLEALRACLGKLSARTREILNLVYRTQLPLKDVAASIKLKASSVRQLLWRTRKTLANCIRTKIEVEASSPW